jgi:hypothetical protein
LWLPAVKTCDWNTVSAITISLNGFVAGSNTVALFADSGSPAPDLDWIEVMSGTSVTKVDPTLVGYWKFDEGDGSTLNDDSGTGNDATITNQMNWNTNAATLPPLQFANKAALLLGSGAYATAGTTGMPATNAAQTISAWINIAALSSAHDEYLVSLWNPATTKAVSMGVRGNQFQVWGWGPNVLVGVPVPSLKSWHHVYNVAFSVTQIAQLAAGAP